LRLRSHCVVLGHKKAHKVTNSLHLFGPLSENIPPITRVLAQHSPEMLTNKSGETMRKSLGEATELVLGLKDDEPEKPASVAPVYGAKRIH